MRKKFHPVFAASLAAVSVGTALLVFAGARRPARAEVVSAVPPAEALAAFFDFSAPADWMSRNAVLLGPAGTALRQPDAQHRR